MNHNNIVKVALGNQGYDIVVGTSIVGQAGYLLQKIVTLPEVIIVTDVHVAKLYLEEVKKALQDVGIRSHVIILPPGEGTKSLSQLEQLLDKIFSFMPERGTTLVALGGGVVGDITGFAASIVLRGIPFIQIPTTFLAQVDSSVGGKTGINNRFGKNLIGAFYQPKLVLADVGLLATLSEREYLAGYAEVIKYGMIQDRSFFEWLEAEVVSMKARDIKALVHAVSVSCACKAKIVAEDEKEKDKRAWLNFGHTFGHALEKETGYSHVLLHGEAVAIGMVLATALSERLGYAKKGITKRLVSHLKAMGLRTSLGEIRKKWSSDALCEAILRDKKVSQGKPALILVRDIGDAYVEEGVEISFLKQFLDDVIQKGEVI